MLLKASAARHRVAPKLIAGSEDLERLATETEPATLRLSRAGGGACFGEDALRLKRGEIALTLAGSEVVPIAT